MKNCKHKNIIMTEKNRFFFKQGWEAVAKDENAVLDDYLTNNKLLSIFCEDCGEYFERC